MPTNPLKTRCTIPGCRAWAICGSDPPRRSPHSGRTGAPPGNRKCLVHGFYATTLHPQELADLAAYAGDTSLDAEIAITRVALRRVLGMLLTGYTPGPDPAPLDALDYARYSGLAFRGAITVSRLLRARHDLGGDRSDATLGFLDQALDQLSSEWGLIPLIQRTVERRLGQEASLTFRARDGPQPSVAGP
jgi:hypothetical protein